MNQPNSYDPIDAILAIHSMLGTLLLDAVEDVPGDRMTEQPGTIFNHPAWTLSHLNAYAGVLLSMLDDPSTPTANAEMDQFGYGTTPVPDPGAYATKAELLERFRERHGRIGTVVAQRHSECFPKPAPERFRPWSPTIGHLAITLIVAHPPHHLGQLRQWRRAAGLPLGA